MYRFAEAAAQRMNRKELPTKVTHTNTLAARMHADRVEKKNRTERDSFSHPHSVFFIVDLLCLLFVECTLYVAVGHESAARGLFASV